MCYDIISYFHNILTLLLHPSTMSNQEKTEKRVKLGEEAYQAWLNQPPIQFPLYLDSLIMNSYNNNGSSHVGNRGNGIDVCIDELL